jgi:hypothetical protein
MPFLVILMVEQIVCTSETITHWTLANNRQRNVSHTCMTRGHLLVICRGYVLQAPQRLIHVGLRIHIVWCNAKDVGDREIPEIYLNSASKNTSGTGFLVHGTKYLLTSVMDWVINSLYCDTVQHHSLLFSCCLCRVAFSFCDQTVQDKPNHLIFCEH